MKILLAEWKRTIFIAALILLIAVFLRVYKLGYLPVFADEAIYVRWSQVMKVEPTLRFLPLSDGKQPLFMWMTIPFITFIKDPLIAGRLVSVFSGIGTLFGVFAITYFLFKSKKALLLSGFIYAISPYSVFFDRMALVDSMLTMFGVWTLFFSLLVVKTLRIDTAMVAGFTLGAALLTKSPALFFIILIPFTAFFSDWPESSRKKIFYFAKLLSLWMIIIVIGYVIYSILRLGPNYHLIASRNQDYVYPISHLLQRPLDPFMPHIIKAVNWFWLMSPGPLMIIGLFSIILGIKKRSKKVIFLSIWLLLPILVQAEFAKAFTTRYTLFSFPSLVILASVIALTSKKDIILSNFPKNMKRIIPKLTFALVLLFCLQSLYIDYLLLNDIERAPLPRVMRGGYLEEWTAGIGIKETSEIIRSEHYLNPSEKIVVGTEGYFGTLPDALQAYLNDLTDVTVIGVGLDFTQLPNSLKESWLAGNKTYLVVNSTRLEGEPEELGLKLVAAYPKALRPEDIKEYVMHGPRETMYLFEVFSVESSVEAQQDF